MKIGVIFGTRPEIVKLAPVLKILEKKKRDYFTLHTGQHYSYEMDRLFFEQLELAEPDFKLSQKGGAARHGEQTGRMLQAIEPILFKEKPDVVLVQGDTNSVLAGALAASKIPGIRIGHVEAGLRSFDRGMPEETNRIVTDHLSDFLFAPTPAARKILVGEGIDQKKVFMTGNTIVDAVSYGLAIARKKINLRKIFPETSKDYFLLTLHRQENVDNRRTLEMILEGLRRVHAAHKATILFPAHPRTRDRIKRFGFRLPGGVRLVKPVGFLEFLRLEEQASLILTDSGGVQEEACILRVPCVTLRTSTERPETVAVGANLIAGHDPELIFKSAARMKQKSKRWANPFGDGKSGARILSLLEKNG